MADDDTTDSPAAGTQGDGSVEQRVDSLEAKVDKILGIVSNSPAEEDPRREKGEQETGRGGIGEEISRQLEERDRRKAAADAEQAEKDRLAGLETKISELTEKTPEPLPRRVEKLMGWR